jgi:Zn-dependent peptidase ImmA (M78 family)
MVKKVRVDGIDYEVIRTDAPIVFEGKTGYGKIDYEDKKIYVSTAEGTEASRHHVLYHEVLHAVIHERTLTYGNTVEETFIDELAKGWFNVVQDNPELVNSKHWKGK